jgi:tetratricopeptide (TPR) repeat protein
MVEKKSRHRAQTEVCATRFDALWGAVYPDAFVAPNPNTKAFFMQKEKLLYGLIGVLIGVIVGYLGTDALNQKYATTAEANAPMANSVLMSGGAEDGAQNDVMAVIEQARKEPENFDAQLQAGNLFAQINRFDQAVEFYERARKVKPQDEQLLQRLTAALLGKGDKAAARTAFQQLERVNPKNSALEQLRGQL